MTVKMKFSFVLFLLVDIPLLNGQQKIEESERILLRLTFPSDYNSYNKFCCKLYPGGCYKLLDSAGYTCDLLRGRVTKTENDGWVQFEISNVHFVDGGYYRCIVLGTQIYSDHYFEVSEVSGHHSQSEPSLTTTIEAPNSSTTLLYSQTGAVLAEDHGDSARAPWSFGLPLAVIVSITVMFLITSVIGVVFYRVKAKCKENEKYGETLCESLKQEAPETSGIVYTTVDFRAHQKPTEVYANPRMHKTQVDDCDSTQSADHDGMVEYSTLAIHQRTDVKV